MATKRRARTAKAASLLRAAQLTGDLPTARLWLSAATTSSFERGVALLEALADPLLEGPERLRVASSFIDSLEDWLALEEAGATVLLHAATAKASRFDAASPRLLEVARLVDAPKPSLHALERYAKPREALLDRTPKVQPGAPWRLDQGSNMIPSGGDVSISPGAAAALAELRRAASQLCSIVSSDAVAPFLVGEAAPPPTEIACAASVVRELRASLATLHETSARCSEAMRHRRSPK